MTAFVISIVYNTNGDYMQTNRLFQILYILLNKKYITAKELAKKLEVSTRTIYRDIDVLSSSGIPIYTSKGSGGGLHLVEDFVFNKTLLSSKEQKDILAALNNFNIIPEDNKLLEKMSNLFQKDNYNWIDIDFSPWGVYNKELFDDLKRSILGRNLISFDYFNSYGNESSRVVQPLQIWFKNRAWYLKAICREKDFRIFKCNRIKNLKILDEIFPPVSLPENKYIDDKNSSLTAVKLLISKKIVHRVYDEFQEENITVFDEENFLVNFSYPEDNWLYGYILSFGSNAKVIEPPHIKEIIIKELKKNLENYS